MGVRRHSVWVSRGQRAVLETILRCGTAAQQLVRRAKCILTASGGLPNHVVSEQIGMSANQVSVWCGRWQDAVLSLRSVELAGPAALREGIEAVLGDAPRSGAPPKFSTEQVVQIAAIAQESPEESGRPVSHWTPEEIAQEAQLRGIVKAISVRQVGRFLKEGRPAAASQPAVAQLAGSSRRSVRRTSRRGLRSLPSSGRAIRARSASGVR
jgi:putative transposase